jgi:arylformamidase
MKTKDTIWWIIIVALITATMVHQWIVTQGQKMNKQKPGSSYFKAYLEVIDTGGKSRRFLIGLPVSAGRNVLLNPFVKSTQSSNAFFMPLPQAQTLEFEDQFVGDVERGGSCNVDILSFVPHGITHLETSAHILSAASAPPTVKDIPPQHLSGIALLIDLTHLETKPGSRIPWDAVEEKLKQNVLPVSMLAIKTRASLLPPDYDFSGNDFLSVSPSAARGIHDYEVTVHRNADPSTALQRRIDCLILDLPSIDPEEDQGKLLAHRNYFGLPETGHDASDLERRVLVELARFNNLSEGYFFVTVTPPLFQANAVSTGIMFQPLTEILKY